MPSGGDLFREDMTTHEITFIISLSGINNYDDYGVGNNKTYRYILQKASITNGVLTGGKFVSDTITPSWTGWYLTDIQDVKESHNGLVNSRYDVFSDYRIFKVSDTWLFAGDIQNTTTTQNVNKTLHVGINQYPTLSETDTNYTSATLTGLVGYIDCSSKEFVDTSYLISDFRKFITQHKQFILRSHKGDVWAVNITNNPTVEYEEGTNKTLSNFSFDWAEFSDMSELILTYGTILG